MCDKGVTLALEYVEKVYYAREVSLSNDWSFFSSSSGANGLARALRGEEAVDFALWLGALVLEPVLGVDWRGGSTTFLDNDGYTKGYTFKSLTTFTGPF
jgi:hypothetical protein